MVGVRGVDRSCSVYGADQNGKTAGQVLASKVDAKPHSYWAYKFLEGESYKGAPILKFQINQDGAVSDVKLVRSSGVHDVDRKKVIAVSHWKYEPGVGCGIVETNMSLTIDWQ
jgi:TonB family protein